jgi:hypothetical protein
MKPISREWIDKAEGKELQWFSGAQSTKACAGTRQGSV